jgi:pyrimidine operon attenuation protein / uracil phosphoribosyltransferase
MASKQILNGGQIMQKIKRIAFEIYENNFEEQEMIIAGIKGQGYTMAKMLAQNIQEISAIKANFVQIIFDKNSPYDNSAEFDCDERFLEKKTIIVVDDVLNTGRTLAYSLSPFLTIPIKRLQVAVMVDRDYRRFPIKADFVGYMLSTTMTDHIRVELENESKMGIYLD